MKIRVLRCRICGDSYLGTAAPTRCPFCGAPARFFVDAHEWNADEFEVTLSDVSRGNLEKALALELSNTAFYACATEKAKAGGDAYTAAKFKVLMKVEREHASAICKFLKRDVPALEAAPCSAEGAANSKEGFEREDRAIKAYASFRDAASEARMEEFFSALVEIETDHLDLHKADLA